MTKKQKRAGKKNLAKARKKLKPSANKFMRKSGKTKGKAIATSVRKRTATIVQKVSGPRGGSKRYRFPMPDATHARNALARLPLAKGLTPAQKQEIRQRALRILGKKDKFAKGMMS